MSMSVVRVIQYYCLDIWIMQVCLTNDRQFLYPLSVFRNGLQPAVAGTFY